MISETYLFIHPYYILYQGNTQPSSIIKASGSFYHIISPSDMNILLCQFRQVLVIPQIPSHSKLFFISFEGFFDIASAMPAHWNGLLTVLESLHSYQQLLFEAYRMHPVHALGAFETFFWFTHHF